MFDWFLALDGPVQVALIVGVLGGGGLAGLVTAFRARSAPLPAGRQAEIAALTLDSSAVTAVADAISAHNTILAESLKVDTAALKVDRDRVSALRRVADELKELRAEIRTQGDRLK